MQLKAARLRLGTGVGYARTRKAVERSLQVSVLGAVTGHQHHRCPVVCTRNRRQVPIAPRSWCYSIARASTPALKMRWCGTVSRPGPLCGPHGRHDPRPAVEVASQIDSLMAHRYTFERGPQKLSCGPIASNSSATSSPLVSDDLRMPCWPASRRASWRTQDFQTEDLSAMYISYTFAGRAKEAHQRIIDHNYHEKYPLQRLTMIL